MITGSNPGILSLTVFCESSDHHIPQLGASFPFTTYLAMLYFVHLFHHLETLASTSVIIKM